MNVLHFLISNIYRTAFEIIYIVYIILYQKS